jgi:hypothetical protein
VTNNVQGTQKHIDAFAAANKARIDALRTNLGWIKKKDGSPRHPERWTNHPLDVDARQVDTLGHSFKFEEFYETEYRKVCWSVHGSGFVMRSIQTDAFPSLAGLLFPPCISLALLSSELVLQHLGLWGADQKKQFSFAKVQHAQIVEQTRRATLSLPSEPPPGSGTGTV